MSSSSTLISNVPITRGLWSKKINLSRLPRIAGMWVALAMSTNAPPAATKLAMGISQASQASRVIHDPS